MKILPLAAAISTLMVALSTTSTAEPIHSVASVNTLQSDADRQTALMLSHGIVNQNYDAALYLPSSAFAEMTKVLEGTKVLMPAPAGEVVGDIVLEVTRVSLKTEPGRGVLVLGLKAVAEKLGVTAAFEAEGVLYFLGTESAAGTAFAKFGIALGGLRSSLDAGAKGSLTEGLSARLVGELASKNFASGLQLSVPLPPMLTASVGLDQTLTAKVPSTDGSVTLQLNIPELPVSLPVELKGAVFTSTGVYLVTSESGVTLPPAEETAEDTSAFFAGQKGQSPGNPDEVSLRIRGGFLARCLSELDRLSPAQRTATIKEISHVGDLYASEFDTPLGRGGLSARLDDGGSATVRLGPLASEWVAGEGVRIAAPVVVGGSTNVHLHGDIGPGGGIGTSVKMIGDARLDLNATVTPVMLEMGGYRCLVLQAKGGLQPVSFKVTTDGNFKCDLGRMSVAKVGASVNAKLNPEALPPLVMLTDAPFVLAAPRLSLPSGFTSTSPSEKLSFRAIPTTVQSDATGFNVSMRVEIKSLSANDLPAISQDAARKLTQKLASDEAAKTQLVQDLEIKAEVGGLSFDKIPILGSAIHEVKKFIKTPLKSIADAPGNVVRELGKAPEFVANVAENAPKVVAKVAEKAPEVAAKVVVATPKVIVKAAEEAPKAVVKAGGWVKRKLGF